MNEQTARPAAATPSPAWQVFAITFVAYFVTGRLAWLLAIPPGNACPLFPAAGVGVAAVFVWGRPALVGVFAGALAADLWGVAGQGAIDATVVLTWVATAFGATLQSALGAWLLRRHLTHPLVLSEPADLARFMLGVAPLTCVVSASIATLALRTSGTIPADAMAGTWAAWWVGDTLGVLIGAPILWSFIASPRDAWAPRRWAVAVPLTLATGVMALGIAESMRYDSERTAQAFQREADTATQTVVQAMRAPLAALEAMRGLADAVPALEQSTFGRSARPWIADAPGLVAVGLSERVERNAVAAFEARQRDGGFSGYRVFERWPEGSAPPAPDDPMMVVRFIEPLGSNSGALGVNSRSVPRARSAVDAATRAGTPVASESFGLSQGGIGVVVYQALYKGEPATPPQRDRALTGVVFVALQPERLLSALAARWPAALAVCLLDPQAAPAARLLGGPAACATPAIGARVHEAALPFAAREWQVRVVQTSPMGDVGVGRTWPLALIGLASAAMLGALLLTITGRARRIESAVVERTAELEQRSSELQAESAQRQRTAAALRESQQRLRNILDHVPIGVAYTDTEGRVREANPYLRQLLGMTSERLNGMPIARVLHPDDRSAEDVARRRLLAGELPMARAQLRLQTADGRTIAARTSTSLLRSAKDNEPRRLVYVLEDITEHLALEEAQRAREGAEAANRAKSEFLSRMSHELRTPLNALLGFTQLLELDRKQPLASHQLEWTQQMRHAGWHLLHMINDTLDLARIESGHVELEPRTLDLAELVDAARALVQQAADKRRVQIDVHLGLGARAVIGDATRVKQILTNLLSNAVKYNVEGGSVIVSSRLADEGRIALEVIDTGAGMSGQQLAQLFQPFNRLGQESGSIEGTGIGLVISLRLAELMGGTLHARSSVGMGSTFTLELPRGAVASTPAAPDEEDEGIEPAAYRRRLIHYIEDNETNAEVMRGILALRPQVELTVSALGRDGFEVVRRRRPSLVLLDMHLPDVEGLELLRQLQEHPDTADIPVIVVSADATQARVSQAIAAGATHYLTKPVNVPTFLAAIDGVLDQLDTHFG